MTRIDMQKSPAEAARWWRDQVQRERLAAPAPRPTAESEYLAGAKACTVDHGQGKAGERKRRAPGLTEFGADRRVDQWYKQGTLRIA